MWEPLYFVKTFHGKIKSYSRKLYQPKLSTKSAWLSTNFSWLQQWILQCTLWSPNVYRFVKFHTPVEGSSDTTWTHLGLFYQLYKSCIIPLRRRETRLSCPDNPARWNEYVRNTIQETARGRIITHSKQENSLKNIRKLNSGNQYIVSVSYVKGDFFMGGGVVKGGPTLYIPYGIQVGLDVLGICLNIMEEWSRKIQLENGLRFQTKGYSEID